MLTSLLTTWSRTSRMASASVLTIFWKVKLSSPVFCSSHSCFLFNCAVISPSFSLSHLNRSSPLLHSFPLLAWVVVCLLELCTAALSLGTLMESGGGGISVTPEGNGKCLDPQESQRGLIWDVPSTPPHTNTPLPLLPKGNSDRLLAPRQNEVEKESSPNLYWIGKRDEVRGPVGWAATREKWVQSGLSDLFKPYYKECLIWLSSWQKSWSNTLKMWHNL